MLKKHCRCIKAKCIYFQWSKQQSRGRFGGSGTRKCKLCPFPPRCMPEWHRGKVRRWKVRCWAGKNSADHQSCTTITQAGPSLMEVSFLKTFLRVRSQVHLKVLCPILLSYRQEPELSALHSCLRSSCWRCSSSCFPFLLGLPRCICGTAVALSRGSNVCSWVRSQRRAQEMLG